MLSPKHTYPVSGECKWERKLFPALLLGIQRDARGPSGSHTSLLAKQVHEELF